jgi:hypothetical protein
MDARVWIGNFSNDLGVFLGFKMPLRIKKHVSADRLKKGSIFADFHTPEAM